MKKRLLITGIFDSNTEETLSDCGIILVRYLEKTHTLEIHCRYKNEAITTSSDLAHYAFALMHFLFECFLWLFMKQQFKANLIKLNCQTI